MVFISEILADFIVRLVTPTVAPAPARDGLVNARTSRPVARIGACRPQGAARHPESGDHGPVAAC